MEEKKLIYGIKIKKKNVNELKLNGSMERRKIFQKRVGRLKKGMIVKVKMLIREIEGQKQIEKVNEVMKENYEGKDIVEVVKIEEREKIKSVDEEEIDGKEGMKILVFGKEDKGKVNMVEIIENIGKGD